jgi:hypothetical protein
MSNTCTEKRIYLFIRVVVGVVRTVNPPFLIRRIALISRDMLKYCDKNIFLYKGVGHHCHL